MVNRLCAEGDFDENDRPNDGRLRKMTNLFNLIFECSDCVWKWAVICFLKEKKGLKVEKTFGKVKWKKTEVKIPLLYPIINPLTLPPPPPPHPTRPPPSNTTSLPQHPPPPLSLTLTFPPPPPSFQHPYLHICPVHCPPFFLIESQLLLHVLLSNLK